MSAGISANYRQITKDEAWSLASIIGDAWKDPRLPALQDALVRDELQRFRNGQTVSPYQELIDCLQPLQRAGLTVLDVGAGVGHYRDVLHIAGFDWDYTALDSSEAFADYATRRNPDIRYELGDARDLPYVDSSFHVVLHSGTLIHILDWPIAIREAARVASQYVVLHRTPISSSETRYWTKDAYGISCLELHFSKRELLGMCAGAGLQLRRLTEISWNAEMQYGYQCLLFEHAQLPEPYASDLNV